MTQDIEDLDGFGAPTELEMWKHQVVLITNEAEYLTRELGKARRNIAKLVAMNRRSSGITYRTKLMESS